MNEKISGLKLMCERFKRGNENPYSVKTEVLKILEEAKVKGDNQIIDEIEEILMDMHLSINQNKCNCNHSSCCYYI